MRIRNLPRIFAFILIVQTLTSISSVSAKPADTTAFPFEIDTGMQGLGQIGGLFNGLARYGNLAYVGMGPRLTVIDFSTPFYPRIVGQTSPMTCLLSAVYIQGGYAYVLEDQNCRTNYPSHPGLLIFSLSNPTSPMQIGYLENVYGGTDLVVQADYAYISAANGLLVVDVSNPSSPRFVGQAYSQIIWGWKVSVSGNIALISTNQNGLRILDVSNPTQPLERSVYQPSSGWVTASILSGNYIFAAATSGITVINLSNPSSPQVITSINLGDMIQDIFLKNGFLYCASLNSGLVIVDINTPTNPQVVGSLPLSFDIANQVDFSGGTLLLETNNVLLTVDVTDPQGPSELGRVVASGLYENIDQQGGYVFAASGARGMVVIDARNPASLQILGDFFPTEAGFTVNDVDVDGNRAYLSISGTVLGTEGYLCVLNINDPSNPTEIGRYDLIYPSAVRIFGGRAYVLENGGELSILDISDPQYIRLIGNYSYVSEGIRDLVVSSNYVYATLTSNAFVIINTSDLLNIHETGRVNVHGISGRVAVDNGYAYVTQIIAPIGTVDAGFSVIDISQPNSPKEVGYYGGSNNQFEGWGVAARAGFAYVGTRGPRQWYFDVTNPTLPTPMGMITLAGPSTIYDVAIDNEIIYVAANNSGLYTLRKVSSAKKPVVVLVHGWQGLGERQYHCSDGITPYPLDQNFADNSYPIPGNLADWLVEAGYEVWSAHLDSGPFYTASLLQNAYCLRDQITRVSPRDSNGKVILIAHSMGGLVARAYLEDSNLYRGNVEKIITLGTPHQGIPWAPLATFVDRLNLVVQLDCNSQAAVCEFTSGIQDFNNSHNSRRTGVDYYQVGGDLSFWDATLKGKLLGALIHGPDDGIVPLNSSTGLNDVLQTLQTSESHASILGPTSYFTPPGGDRFSLSFVGCIGPVLGGNRFGCLGSPQQAKTPSATLTEPDMNAYIPVDEGQLSPGVEITKSLVLDENSPTLFFSTWSPDKPVFTLVTPNGQQIDPTYAQTHPEEVEFLSTDYGAGYSFISADSGEWIMSLDMPNTGSAISYTLSAVTQSQVTLDSGVQQDWYRPGDEAQISARLSGVASGAQVTATMQFPNGNVITLPLNEGNSNVFVAQYILPDIPGFVQVTFLAQGTSSTSTHFIRETRGIFQIAGHSAQLLNTYSETPVPNPFSNNFYSGLEIAADVNVINDGIYGLTADLTTNTGQVIAHAAINQPLREGDRKLILTFSGEQIAAMDIDGPYYLTNLALFDLSGAALKLDQADFAYTTAPYSASQFIASTLFLPIMQR